MKRVDHYLIAVLATLFIANHAVNSSAQINEVNDPLVAGTDYHTFRIPGFAVAADGSLLLFAEGRPNSSDPGGPGDIDLVFKRSTDGGASWSPIEVLHTESEFDYSDPRIVVDQSNEAVHLQYVQWPTHCGQTCVPVGLGNDSSVIFWQISADHGASWTGPININSQVKDPNWASLNTGPGIGIQLKWQDADPTRNGRLVMPGHQRPVAYRGVGLLRDVDDTTWRYGTGVTPGHADESEIVELTNGDLLWDARQSGGNARRRYISHDGGDTWGEEHSGDIPVTPVDTGILRYSATRDGDDRDRILYSAPLGSPAGSGNSRNNIGIWTSYDEGLSFINPVQIQSGSSAYSVIDKLPDDSIGLVYEINHQTIRYVNFELGQLEKSVHSNQLTHYDGFDNEIVRHRGGVGWTGPWHGDGTFTAQSESTFNGDSSVPFDGFSFERLEGRLDLNFGDDGEVHRTLSKPIEMNSNKATYMSLLITAALDSSQDVGSQEFLDIELLDSNGSLQAAFGVGSGEAFFLVGVGDTVATDNDFVQPDEFYFLVAKIVAQDDSNGSNFDQMFLRVFESGETIPQTDANLDWTLVGSVNENINESLTTLSIEGGNNAYWSVDEIRIGESWTAVATGFLRGDVNCDGAINLLDVAPFVELLSSGQYEIKADMNEDGLVNLLDVAPFVSVLLGP